MNYVKQEPHQVKALMSYDDKMVAVKALPIEVRFHARLLPFCSACEHPVAMDKLGRYRHVA